MKLKIQLWISFFIFFSFLVYLFAQVDSPEHKNLIKKLNEIFEDGGLFHTPRFCLSEHPLNSKRCRDHIFGTSEDFILEPFWSQWRVGGFLKNDLLTEKEKQRKIKVGLIDQGANTEHDAFWGIAAQETRDTSQTDHGMNVAAIFCSRDDCSVGRPEADFFFYNARQDAQLYPALHDALDRDIRVINISMEYLKNPYSEKSKKLLDKIHQKNVIVVWSAGNDDGFFSRPFPTDIPNLWSISSIDPFNRLSHFSNSGPETDFTAPSDSLQRALGGNPFGGTSGAAPVISGIVMNVLKVNPQLTPDRIKTLLKMTSFDTGAPGFDPEMGWGMPNMVKAILAARYLKEGKLTFDPDPQKMKSKLEALFQKEISPLSHEALLQQSTNCTEYIHGLKKLVKNYFLTEDPSELCKFYKHHKIYVSAALYCQEDTQDLVAPLIESLQHSNPNIRKAAAYGLSKITPPAAIPDLIKTLGDTDQKVAEASNGALVYFGTQAISPLMDALQHQNPKIKYQATFALTKLTKDIPEEKREKIKNHLITVIQNEAEDLEIRRISMVALAHIVPPSVSIPVIAPFLLNKNINTRSSAAYSLAQTRSSQAVPPLIDYLEKFHTEGDMLLIQLGNVFAFLGDTAVQPLIEKYQSIDKDNKIFKKSIELCLSNIREHSKNPETIQKINQTIGK